MAGVDLAPRMISAARRRGCYHELAVGDIATALRPCVASFDLVLAADVFVYIGDLAETFGLAAIALRPAGLFAFSVEAHEGEAYVLGPTRRYQHSLAYVRKLAAEHGLTEAHAQRSVLRTDAGAEVTGWIVVLRK
jgi:predicted TPR repeat methyltransferase